MSYVFNNYDDFIAAKTRVFWDLDDFPIPPGRSWESLENISNNIREALDTSGYRGNLSIHGYASGGKVPYKARCHYRCAGVQLTHLEEDKYTRLNTMLFDMIDFAHENPLDRSSEQVNLLVISKDIPDVGTEFVNVLKGLQRRNFNVFLVVPDDLPQEQVPLPSTASLVWRWTNLYDGDIPIESDSDSDEDKVKAAHLTDKCECRAHQSCH